MTARTLEVRRHSIRDRHSAHLNQTGVDLARTLGVSLPRFSRVYTSPIQRAVETALAMGYAVSEEIDVLGLPDDNGLMFELEQIKRFRDAGRLIRTGQHVPILAAALGQFAQMALADLADGEAALAVSHGGIVEVFGLACAPDADPLALGDGISFCEGVRLTQVNGVTRLTVLRV
jgi:broad specificity phosphatase PhoE